MYTKIKYYMIGGMLSVMIDTILLGIFFDGFHFSILISSLFAFVGSSLFGYFYHRNISFKSDSKKSHGVQLGQFIIVNSASQILYMIILYLGVDIFSIYYLIVAIIGKGIIFVINFALHKMFTFRNNKNNLLVGITLFVIGLLGGGFILYHNYGPDTSHSQEFQQKEEKDIVKSFEGITRYQIIPDRFENGNPNNDYVTSPLDWALVPEDIQNNFNGYQKKRTSDWYQTNSGEQGVFDSLVNTLGWQPQKAQAYIYRYRWYGGDFEGIRKRIPYLKELGVGGIFLNPIRIANSSMRYDTLDHRHIDPRLSSDDTMTGYNEISKLGREWSKSDIDFHKLVNELHDNGMVVMIDLAFTYSAATSFFLEDIARNGKSSQYYTRFELFYEGERYYEEKDCKLSDFRNGEGYDEAKRIRMNGRRGHCPMVYVNRNINGSIHPDLEARYKAIISRWMSPQTIEGVQYKGVDAIRLDAVAELPIQLRKSLYEYVKSIKPNGIVIGEERSNNFSFMDNGELDGTTNYFTRTLAELFFIGKNNIPITGNSFYKLINDEYGKEKRKYRTSTLNQVGSHDTDRIFSKLIFTNRDLNIIDKDIISNPNLITSRGHHIWDGPQVNKLEFGAKYIKNKPSASDYLLRKSIAMLQFVLPGAPNIYYGDEVGMRGADDPDNRKPMLWSDYSYENESICLISDRPNLYCKITDNTDSIQINKELFETYKKLIKLRGSSLALQKGDVKTDVNIDRSIDNGVYALSRIYEDDIIYYITNQSTSYKSERIIINTNNKNSERLDPINEKVYKANRQGNITLEVKSEDSIILHNSSY